LLGNAAAAAIGIRTIWTGASHLPAVDRLNFAMRRYLRLTPATHRKSKRFTSAWT